ncbi:MAG: hypothetical protein A2138_16345 [Deltaproteobacteria bacterium RBG_16_71_12]|nr:MAG: hypothetical protein A2138_16345 [Deltaproteobacteria bacterium RBG_16_71_12]
MLLLVGVGVLIAIVAVLRGEPFGETLAKVINTAIVTGIFGLLAIACADAAERRSSLLAYAGVVAALTAMVVFFIGVWFEAARHPWWWKAMAVSSSYALALWRATRLSLADVTGTLATMVVRGTIVATLAIATIITLMVLREQATPGLVRLMNACWILSIGGHIAVPILERLAKR